MPCIQGIFVRLSNTDARFRGPPSAHVGLAASDLL